MCYDKAITFNDDGSYTEIEEKDMIGIGPTGPSFNAVWAYKRGLITYDEMKKAIQRFKRR